MRKMEILSGQPQTGKTKVEEKKDSLTGLLTTLKAASDKPDGDLDSLTEALKDIQSLENLKRLNETLVKRRT